MSPRPRCRPGRRSIPPRSSGLLSVHLGVFSLFLLSPVLCTHPSSLCRVFCCGLLWGCQVANAVIWAGPAQRCCLSRPSYMCWSNTMSCMKRTSSSLQVTWKTLFICHDSKRSFFSCKTKHTLAAVQVRLSYLQILGDLKMYNGRIFNATLMVQMLLVYVLGFWHIVLLPCFMHLLQQCARTKTAKTGHKKQF